LGAVPLAWYLYFQRNVLEDFQNEQIRRMDFVSPIIHFALKWTATIAFRMK